MLGLGWKRETDGTKNMVKKYLRGSGWSVNMKQLHGVYKLTIREGFVAIAYADGSSTKQ